ncbi:caspase-3-like [Misgurnus anguillicaudatus]|uniref:caspase-3-like n=1 Tax=Misgurnus anguillicaudatus TaxID=75329 RepID=UPI003CCF08F5
MADQTLKNLRVELVQCMTEAVIKDLVDDLVGCKVLSSSETEEILLPTKPRSDHARGLIDSVKVKGKIASEKMLRLLETRDKALYDNLNISSLLEALNSGEATSSGRNVTSGERKSSREAEQGEYKMDSTPRGLCVIINNKNFKTPKKDRVGSECDVDSLQDAFKFLGFTVKTHQNLSADEMKTLMTQYSKDDRHGDCFVCCVSSHGNQCGIIGIDEKTCPLKDITSPFNGVNCSSLIGKPKVFFIQACRGKEMQRKVQVEADDMGGEADDMGGEPDQEFDNVPDEYIASDSDFLIVMSTVEGYFSLRNKVYGSWFIESLCRHLKDGSKRGQDILKILTTVNNDVSSREGTIKINKKRIDAKMVPEPHFTLRKTLIFRVPEGQSTQE